MWLLKELLPFFLLLPQFYLFVKAGNGNGVEFKEGEGVREEAEFQIKW